MKAVETELIGVRDIVSQNRNDWLNFRSVLTDARITQLDNLDAKVSTRAAANTALSNTVWTNARAGYLDKVNTNLDAKISEVKTIANNALTKAEAARVAAVSAEVSLSSGVIGAVPKSIITNSVTKSITGLGVHVLYSVNGKGKYMPAIISQDYGVFEYQVTLVIDGIEYVIPKIITSGNDGSAGIGEDGIYFLKSCAVKVNVLKNNSSNLLELRCGRLIFLY